MKRIFESEKQVDLLINEYTRQTGIKIAKVINNSIYSWFLPFVPALSVEANFILQQEEQGLSDEWIIKQSLSRGVTWLSKYPIDNPNVLKNIILRFNRSSIGDIKEDTRNDYVKSLYEMIENKIKEKEPNYRSLFYQNLGLDIVDHWDILWQEEGAYQILSTIIFSEESFQPFTWYECILFLKEFEELANLKYGLK